MGTSPGEPDITLQYLERLAPMPRPVAKRMGLRVQIVYGALAALLALVASHTVLPHLFAHGLADMTYPLIALILNIAIHEAGHLIAGLSTGFEFLEIRMWPVSIRKRGKKLSVTFSPALNIGFTSMVPGESAAPWRYATFALGGPVASLFGAIDAFAMLPTVHSRSGASLVSWIALTSFEFFVNNLIPSWRDGAVSDGAHTLDAIARSERWQREVAFGRVLRSRLAGTGYGGTGEGVLDDLTRSNDTSQRAFAAHFIAWHARSACTRSAALPHLEAMLRCSGFATPAQRAHLIAQCVIVTGWFAKNAALAKAWATDLDPGVAAPSDLLRVAGVLAALDGDYLAAIRNAQQLLDDSVTTPEERDETYEQNMGLWIAQLRAMAERDDAPARGLIAAG